MVLENLCLNFFLKILVNLMDFDSILSQSRYSGHKKIPGGVTWIPGLQSPSSAPLQKVRGEYLPTICINARNRGISR